MEELKILKSSARVAFNEADEKGRTLLANLFGKSHFLTKVTDRIKTFEDACQELGIDWDEDDFEDFEPDELAYRKMKIIIRALNEGKELSFKNRSQYKYYPWFEYVGSGFRFLGVDCTGTATYTGLGSRLCFHSDELARYFGNQFIDLINQYLKQDHEN
jgi:hypothetical protein